MPNAPTLGRPLKERTDDRRAHRAVHAVLACNVNPRFSLATILPKEDLARAHASPGVPGRPPAPRAELGCADALEPLPPVKGQRMSRAAQSDPIGPGDFTDTPTPTTPTPRPPTSGPPSGPRPNPEGPLPIPAPHPPVNTQPPTNGPLPNPNGGPVPAPSPAPYPERRCANELGTPQTIAFHFTADSGGPEATAEIRVSRRIPREFCITEIQILPVAAINVGQFVDILISSDDDTTDTATPTGTSIFDTLQGLSTVPAQDRDRGIPMTADPYDLQTPILCGQQNQVIKVQSRFIAPAGALPLFHVVIVLRQYDNFAQPLDPRPPVAAPPLPMPPTTTPRPSTPEPALLTFSNCGNAAWSRTEADAHGLPVCPSPLYPSTDAFGYSRIPADVYAALTARTKGAPLRL